MKRTLLAAGLMLMPLTVHAQQVLDCSSGNCKYVNPTSSSASKSAAQSSATATANSRSRSTAQSGVATGNTINAPVTTTSRATGGTGGQSNVVVVNRVSSGYGGGGFRRGASGSGGGSAAGDPPAATDPAATDPGPALGSSGNPLTENIGGTTTIRNVPEIVAPNISGGNPCLVGVSGGGAGPGIGITLGFGYSDRGCDRRNNAALLSNIGLRDAAMELMCQDDSVRKALRESGHPCVEDRPVAAAAAPQVAQGPGIDPAVVRHEQEAAQPPVPAPVPPPITIVPTSASAGSIKPAWCSTTAPSEMKFHPECR